MRQTFSTSGIMIRRTDFGEADLITTFLTSDMGKVAAIAKYAR
ncbi:MAG: DNA repair protein RecO, partial [Deltaproteobacteria bacterium]